MGTLISTHELQAQLSNPSLRLVDCRFSLADADAGKALYDESHIQGARYAHLNDDLSAPIIPGKTGRHPLPDPADFAQTLGRLGIDNDSMVVAYDDGPGAFAARLWWMMRWAGHDNVFVLDGGFKAWAHEDLPVTTGTMSPGTATFELKPALTKVIAADAIDANRSTLLDARDAARFRGEVEPIDAVAGHIPGARCAVFMENLDATQHMKPAEQLRQRFMDLGADDKPVICYCGSGVTAAHNILAMVHAGFDEPTLYPGSWSEWITDPDRPVERG